MATLAMYIDKLKRLDKSLSIGALSPSEARHAVLQIKTLANNDRNDELITAAEYADVLTACDPLLEATDPTKDR